MGAVGIYQWLDNVLRTEYEEVRLLKQSGRGSVRLIRHRATGRRFILRRYSGAAEVYRKLLDYSCPNLPETLEVAVDAHPGEGVRSLVLEEYVQGDTLDFLLRGRSILSSLILIIGGVGIFIMSIELYVDRWLTGRWQPGWSLVVAAVCLSMMIPLIVVRWRPALRDEVRRRFHM